MSLPVVLPGSCCPAPGSSHADPSHRQRPRGLWCSRAAGAASGQLLPGRPLLSLGLLQLLLGGSMVALSYGALSLSSSAPVRNSCPFWAGSSVILSGIVGLMTWRRPMLLMVNVFVLLSAVCVLLNLAGFILCCQGAQLVSNMSSCQQVGEMCYCCSLAPSSKCPEDKLLELQPAQSCTAMRILLKKMLFALCALNALTTAVCLMAAALRYLRVFTTRTPCLDEPRHPVEEEDPALEPDPDEFVPPAPPPSYFSTFYSYTPRLARRMLRDSVIPLPHIYGARIKGVEVFCPLDPPPPYEEVVGGGAAAEGPDCAVTMNSGTAATGSLDAVSAEELRQAGLSDQLQSAGPLEQLPSAGPLDRLSSVGLVQRKARLSRCSSDPMLTDDHAEVWSSDPPVPHTMDSSTQTSQPILATQIMLRRGSGVRRSHRPRPSSMVDYKSYRHTQLLVQRILEQPAQGLAPEVQELVDSIRTVLQSDQEHMDEAVRCASFMDQVFTDSERKSSEQYVPSSSPQTFPHPPRRRTAVLHLQSCGDLSSVACQSLDSVKQSGAQSKGLSRAEQLEHRHSLIGVFRETVL